MTTRPRHIAAVATIATAGFIGVAGHASAAETSDTVTQQISLDTNAGGTVEAFDPALGTLTQVDWEVTTSARAQLCIENLSQSTGSAVGGTVEAGLTVTFPGSQTTVSAINQAVPEATLTAADGGADCDGYDPVTRTYLAPVSSPDVQYVEAVDPASNSATVTDPAALQEFVGPGTLPYSYTSFSDANVQQPSEWVIIFFADGEYSLTITYTYTPAATTTTTAPPGPTTTAPPGPTTTTPPPGPTTTVAGGSGGGATTTVPGTLPRTGSGSAAVSVAALVLAAAGGALVLLGRRRTTG